MKKCLIISLIWHLFCVFCFSFSVSPDARLLEVYSINFLGSILKEADLVFSNHPAQLASGDKLAADMFLLSNQGKSIKIYDKDTRKPLLALNKLLIEDRHLSQTYKKIGPSLEQEKSAEEKMLIQPTEWQKIKLEIE